MTETQTIHDPPWIRETEATGNCSRYNGAYWNYPDREYETDEWEEDEDGDVFYGSETDSF